MDQPLRVLVVDDDDVDRLAVKRLLRRVRPGIAIDESMDRVSALAAIRDGAFDCVLLDYNIPGTDGLQILESVRATGSTVPIIVLTGQGDEELAVTLMKAGASDYLNKNTLTGDRLERSLRYALDLHRAQQERARLLEREQRAREEAQAANRAKDEFLATLSHELRTPLNAILGWSRLLAAGTLDADGSRRAVEIIDRNTRLQAQLIEDLLDISRIITGKLRLDLRMVPLAAVVESALESVRPAADAKRIRIDANVGNAEAVLCDPSRMQQVIWNLLSNAIKFTPEDGQVTIGLSRQDDSVTIHVSDTGIGIEPEFLPHVFDRFRQQDAASTRAHGGLGLGLAIARHLVELHGGTIEALSAGAGRGSTFLVRVPVASGYASAPEASVESGEDLGDLPSLAGIRVLIVENEPDTRALMREVLEECGATVGEADSAEQALDMLREFRPDVLLSDIAMPGEDGYSLIRRIRALDEYGRSLPAAAFTAYATAQDRARALLAGFQAHIPKPVEPSELAAVVAALAGRTLLEG